MKIYLLVSEFLHYENYKNISDLPFYSNSIHFKIKFFNFIINKLIPKHPIIFSGKPRRHRGTFFPNILSNAVTNSSDFEFNKKF